MCAGWKEPQLEPSAPRLPGFKKLKQDFGFNRREPLDRDKVCRQCRGQARNSSSAESASAQP